MADEALVRPRADRDDAGQEGGEFTRYERCGDTVELEANLA